MPHHRRLRPLLTAFAAITLLACACADDEPEADPGGDVNNSPANNSPANNSPVNNNPNNNNPTNNNPNNPANNNPNNPANNNPINNNPADAGPDDVGPGEDVSPGEDVPPGEDVTPDAPPEEGRWPDQLEEQASSALYRSQGETVSLAFTESSGRRSWTMETTQALRDNDPPSRRVAFTEADDEPRLRSGSVLLDGLFAMAMEETRQNSVTSISDYAFNSGNGVPCTCFETGKNWRYVWTRDTAYAVDLGLALLDPARSRNSLDFKLSAPKAGGSLEIVQDTGSGGSWPVSTDRAVWALGAREALRALPADQRAAFAERAWEAIAQTIARDREVVFDARDGLYRGEQSFLDWREQTYAAWTREDTVHIATAKSLSTNVAHLVLLETAAELAQERNASADAERYTQLATELRQAIRRRFLQSDGTLAALTGPELDPAVLGKLDLLGIAQAILQGVVTPAEGAAILGSYPHGPLGAPVIWPQQPLTRIYHNRGTWPFVTAYAVLAAGRADHPDVFDRGMGTLLRGAALNLSHMENFEFWTQRPWVDDGDYSGPVVNSRRQLWSVAGFAGAVVKGLFGLELEEGGGVRIQPALTASLRRFLGLSGEVVLRDVPVQGRRLTIRLVLPDDASGEGFYAVERVTVDGVAAPEGRVDAADLTAQSEAVVTLGAPRGWRAATVVEDDSDFRAIWAPREPELQSVTADAGGLRLRFSSAEEGVTFRIFRDGQQVAAGLTDTTWLDTQADADQASPCYAVEAEFTSSGHRSHHSRPVCWWGAQGERIQDIPAWRFRASSGAWASTSGQVHYASWGAPADTLEIATLRAAFTGEHLLQLRYGNGAGGIDTGITAGVKEVEVFDLATGASVATGTLVMPQLGRDRWDRWGESSTLALQLTAGRLYRVVLRDSPNMSYLDHFRPYTAGNGGGASPYNFVNISHVRLLARRFTDYAPEDSPLPFNGQDDLASIPPGDRITPGAQVEPWSAYGVHIAGDFLYLAIASPLVEDNYKPVQIYLEAAPGDLPTPSPADDVGLEYSNLTASLPFTPTHALSARRLSDDGSPSGPWNGLWRREGGAWSRTARLQPGVAWWYDATRKVLSLRIPLADLGNPQHLRLAAHVVNAAPANEWKELLPPTHTPWQPHATGFLEINTASGQVTVR